MVSESRSASLYLSQVDVVVIVVVISVVVTDITDSVSDSSSFIGSGTYALTRSSFGSGVS